MTISFDIQQIMAAARHLAPGHPMACDALAQAAATAEARTVLTADPEADSLAAYFDAVSNDETRRIEADLDAMWAGARATMAKIAIRHLPASMAALADEDEAVAARIAGLFAALRYLPDGGEFASAARAEIVGSAFVQVGRQPRES